MNYRLTCMICGYGGVSLVAIQEHLMNAHDYRQEDIEQSKKREVRRSECAQAKTIGYIWTLPDGTDWLSAMSEA